MIARKFREPGDVEAAAACVLGSAGSQRTRELARAHGEKAQEALLKGLDPSPERDSLLRLVEIVLLRSK